MLPAIYFLALYKTSIRMMFSYRSAPQLVPDASELDPSPLHSDLSFHPEPLDGATSTNGSTLKRVEFASEPSSSRVDGCHDDEELSGEGCEPGDEVQQQLLLTGQETEGETASIDQTDLLVPSLDQTLPTQGRFQIAEVVSCFN